MKSLVKRNDIVTVLKGSVGAVCFSLIAILIFAFIIRTFGVNDAFIMPINQVIKIFSIFFGVAFALKNNSMHGLVRGAIIGALYTVIAYLTFSILSASFSFSLSTIYDLLFGTVIGAICGVIYVNLRKN